MRTARLSDYLEDKKSIKNKEEFYKVFSTLMAQQTEELEITPHQYVDMCHYSELDMLPMSVIKAFMGIEIKFVRE